MKTTKHAALTLALLGAFSVASATAQIIAVDFSGDYGATASFNNTLPASQTGDYDFDGTADDRRTYQNIDTVLTIAPGATSAFADGAPSRTSVVRAGFQIANIDSLTDPTFSNRRRLDFAGGDATQILNGAVSTAARMANATNIAKADFLNGAALAPNLTFANIAGSASANALALTTVGSPVMRLLVQDGSNWYISATSRANGGPLTLNGFAESWYAYDPSSNIFYNNSALGASVLGSTFTNIQAFGAIGQSTANFDGSTINTNGIYFNNVSLTVVPEPSTIALLMGAFVPLIAIRRRFQRHDA